MVVVRGPKEAMMRVSGSAKRVGGTLCAFLGVLLLSIGGIAGLATSFNAEALLVVLAGFLALVVGVRLVVQGERAIQTPVPSYTKVMTRAQVLVSVIAVAAVFALMIRNEMRPSLPPYSVVGEQGIVRIVVVPPGVASDDAALWNIAEHLRRSAPTETIQAMFWTDRTTVPTRLPMDDRAMATQVAQININSNSNYRNLRRAPFR